MRCFCGSDRCRKFIGGTQESTADIAGLGDAEDVTHDPEPVMVREDEMDAAVQAMLDKEVGTTQRGWDAKLLKRCGVVCGRVCVYVCVCVCVCACVCCVLYTSVVADE